MFDKVLIANRGEIALRIHRACREMGIATVAVHSTADEEAMHVRMADESVCIGPPGVDKSYLNVPAILTACDVTGADAVHPGYGFLSENAGFAEIVHEHGLTFIGPRHHHIELMGNKVSAREAALSAGLQCVPGSDGEISDPAEARQLADSLGYPVLVKAAAGGGGRGMRLARDAAELDEALAGARAEATAAFGDGSVYLEKFLVEPRHIEVQILADSHGNAIHLGERDCSLQRRHQKLLEEAPSPALNDQQRATIGAQAVAAIQQLEYLNAGTIEFLYADGEFYFIEMNTRLQVEHPITEAVYGVDIVQEQIRIASGATLSYRQADLGPTGHAIECRLNAENPYTFRPSPGVIEQYHAPGGPGVRIDSAVFQGCEVPPFYDSLVGKLIVSGRTREECVMRLRRALGETVIAGIDTTVPLFQDITERREFLNGEYNIGSLEAWLAEREQASATAA